MLGLNFLEPVVMSRMWEVCRLDLEGEDVVMEVVAMVVGSMEEVNLVEEEVRDGLRVVMVIIDLAYDDLKITVLGFAPGRKRLRSTAQIDDIDRVVSMGKFKL